MGGQVGLHPNALADGEIIVQWFSHEDPDSIGNFFTWTCQTQFTTNYDDHLYASASQVRIKNYYGRREWSVDPNRLIESTVDEFNQDDLLENGPWMQTSYINGEGTFDDTTPEWQRVYQKEFQQKTTQTCGGMRVIGSVQQVFANDDNAQFYWGGVNGFIDIKQQTPYLFTSGFKVWANDSDLQPIKQGDNPPFNLQWE